MNEQQAQLRIIQPGSRANFRVNVFEAMQSLVHASSGFVILEHETPVTRTDARRWVVGRARASEAMPEVRSVVSLFALRGASSPQPRRCYTASDLETAEDGGAGDYATRFAASGPSTHVLFAFLYDERSILGACGVERPPEELPFSSDDARALEALVPFIEARLKAVLTQDDAVLAMTGWRTLVRDGGILYVIDRGSMKLIWQSSSNADPTAELRLGDDASSLLDAANALVMARTARELAPTISVPPFGNAVDAIYVEKSEVFGDRPCALVRVEPLTTDSLNHYPLSKREQEIARLLSAGFSAINVAAIVGVSENTVRTHVRRLYHKLGVTNRADLVRTLILPTDMNAPFKK